MLQEKKKPVEKIVKEIRRRTRRNFSAHIKIYFSTRFYFKNLFLPVFIIAVQMQENYY
jgi:hypothetical protein